MKKYMSDMEPAAENVSGQRFCSNCSQNKTSIGGYWKTYANGTKRRWLCSSCSAKRLNGEK
jgi:hypothetical protein